MTPVKVKKVSNAIRENFTNPLSLIDSLDESLLSYIVEQIAAINKITDKGKLDDLREHLLFNIKIIRLSSNVFPDEIRDVLREFFSTYSYLPFNSREFFELKNNQSLL